MSDLFPPSLAEQIACIEREIARRLRVYPRQIAAGLMTQTKADRETALMLAALRTLKETQSLNRHLEEVALRRWGPPLDEDTAT